MDDSYCYPSNDENKVVLTAEEKQAAIDNNDPGDVFGIEDELEALAKQKQNDSQRIQVKVISLEPFAMRFGLDPSDKWKFTV